MPLLEAFHWLRHPHRSLQCHARRCRCPSHGTTTALRRKLRMAIPLHLHCIGNASSNYLLQIPMPQSPCRSALSTRGCRLCSSVPPAACSNLSPSLHVLEQMFQLLHEKRCPAPMVNLTGLAGQLFASRCPKLMFKLGKCLEDTGQHLLANILKARVTTSVTITTKFTFGERLILIGPL